MKHRIYNGDKHSKNTVDFKLVKPTGVDTIMIEAYNPEFGYQPILTIDADGYISPICYLDPNFGLYTGEKKEESE